MEGKPMINFLRGGLKEGFVKTSAYGKAVSEGARKNADAVKANLTRDMTDKSPRRTELSSVGVAAGCSRS